MSITYHKLPGPKGLPLIGNLHQVTLSRLHNYFEKQAETYGDVFKVKLAGTALTVVAKPELILKILKMRPQHFRRISKLDKVLSEEGLHGVFNAEGEEWRLHRKIVTRGLDIKHQQQFFPAMKNIVQRLYSNMGTAAKTGEPYAIHKDLKRFTVDVTTSLAFGIDMNTLQQQGTVIQDHMEKILPVIFNRINNPLPLYKWYKRKSDRDFSSALSEIEKYIRQFIDEGRQRLKDDPKLSEKPENILESLLVASADETAFTDKEIKGNLLTLLMAGEDTTSHALTWAIYLICKHPHIQKRLQQEADEIIGIDISINEYAQHEALSYTTAVIHEVLRLKSVAPVMLAEPTEDIELDGYHFQKGSKLVLLTRAAALSEQYFSDSTAMRPERWLETNISSCPVHRQEAFMPFGSGPRLCPGKNLALLEMKMVLSMLSKNFDMALTTPDIEVQENMAFTMMPDEFDIRLKFR